MKLKFLPILLFGLLATMSIMTSCLDDDIEQITYSSETSITSFSLGTLHVWRTGKDSKGEDSTYTDTISMANYPFTIDQINRKIENKDSLPVGTDISRVITSISADTPYILYGKISAKGEEAKDTTWVSTDSLDFSVAPEEGLTFKVMAYSGLIGKPYYVKINVHTQEPDSLQWSDEPMGTAFASGPLVRQKAVYAHERIYVFGNTLQGKPVAEYAYIVNGTPGSWHVVELPENTDTYSATACEGDVFFTAGHTLYRLKENGDKIYDNSADFSQIVAGADKYLYVRNSDGKFYLYDTQNFTLTLEESIERFPEGGKRLTAVNVSAHHNDELTRTILMGYNTLATDTTGFVATRLTNDKVWSTYHYEKMDTFQCPNIVDPTMIYYDKKIYLFGGEITNKDYETYKSPFSSFFCSIDNGLTWEAVTEEVTFATKGTSFADLYQSGKSKGEASYSCVVDQNNFIWIIWNDGYMSRGRINRFGFLPKWD